MKPVSRAEVKKELEAARSRFRVSWKLIAALHSEGDWQDGLSDLPNFQLQLFDALASLEETYRALAREEKHRVANRKKSNSDWFVKRMRTLARYKEHVEEMLKVGRAIGDAFAWWFYENDRDQIPKHAEKQRQKLLPPQIGRAGERITLENFQVIDGRFLLYHGITDFLRVGDFSLIDLQKRRLVALVETKSAKTSDDTLGVSMNFVSGEPIQLPSLAKPAITSSDKKKDNSEAFGVFASKLKRQVPEMGEFFDRKTSKGRIDHLPVEAPNNFAAIKSALVAMTNSRAGFALTDEGNLFAAIPIDPGASVDPKHDSSSLHLDEVLGPFAEKAKATLVPTRDDNSIIGYTLNDYTTGFGKRSLPLQWWPIGAENLRKVIFGETLLVAFYSPAHLNRLLEDLGFDLLLDDTQKLISAERKEGTKILKFEAFSSFYSELGTGMLSHVGFRKIVDGAVEKLLAEKEVNARLDLDIMMYRYEPVSPAPNNLNPQ